MTEASKTGPTIRESGNLELIKRVEKHLGETALDLTKEQAAATDLGDLEASDPRIRASNKITGQEAARGGSGPAKSG